MGRGEFLEVRAIGKDFGFAYVFAAEDVTMVGWWGSPRLIPSSAERGAAEVSFADFL